MLTLGIYPNYYKPNVKKILGTVIKYLQDRKVQILIPDEIANKLGYSELAANKDILMNKAVLMITMGGDGTILSTVREVAMYGIPVCGINMGQLGFLTEIEISKLWSSLDRLINGNYFIVERLMIDASVIRNNKTLHISSALNDVVVTRSKFSRMIKLKLFIDNELTINYPADGLIISTATGSTGYSLSAGGPIINPNLQVLVITPICPHTLHARSLVVADKEKIKIQTQTKNNDIVLTVDGQIVFTLLPEDTVLIKYSSFKAKFIRFEKKGYYKSLSTKLRRENKKLFS